MSQGIVKKFYYSKWFVLVIFIILVFFTVSAIRDYYSQEDLREDITLLESQISQLETDQQDLIDNLAQVQSEDFVETEARTRLNLRKPGEKVIIVSSSDDVQKLNDEVGDRGIKDLLDEQDSNLKRWWNYFFPGLN